MKKGLVCLLGFLAATAALAQNPPKRPAELKQLDPFIGKWACKGTVFASDWGPEHAFTAAINTQWTLGGYWTKTDYREAKTKSNPMPMDGAAFWGYDTGIKKFVGGWVDNTSMYQTQQSDGWNGDSIVFTGPMHGAGLPDGTIGRDTFTKKGSKQIDHTYEIQMQGNWKTFEKDTCKKTS
jgi:hypothetical protein